MWFQLLLSQKIIPPPPFHIILFEYYSKICKYLNQYSKEVIVNNTRRAIIYDYG